MRLGELLAPENTVFAVALALLVLLLVVQIVGLGHVFPDLDADAPDGDLDVGAGLVSLIGIGQIPFIVWLSCFLATFGLLGLAIQQFVVALLGGPLPALAATGAALIAALPVNALVVRGLALIWPADETTALPIEALVGRRAVIAVGRAAQGSPARATVRDQHGQMHNVMVEPHNAGDSFGEGQEVFLVRREGEIFYALDGQGPIRLID